MHKNIQNITIRTNKPVVVIPLEEYENMKETIALLSLYPELLKELKTERRKIDAGQCNALRDYKKKYKSS